ncbi:glycosyltransferase family 4 protein, partial [PVC group bacterium]|nr:glycosyltransferase family 4 protein [PVC group bacterium]
IAGRAGDKRYHAILKEKAEELSNLSYCGHLSLAKVNDLLSNASIFINTSLPREGFPNTFIQSWMRETPVVSLEFDPDGLIEKNGLGFLSGSASQLKRDVESLLENEENRGAMGRRAREYAINHFDINKTSQSHITAFQQLIS